MKQPLDAGPDLVLQEQDKVVHTAAAGAAESRAIGELRGLANSRLISHTGEKSIWHLRTVTHLLCWHVNCLFQKDHGI